MTLDVKISDNPKLSNSYINDPYENQEKQNFSSTFFLQYGENKATHNRY